MSLGKPPMFWVGVLTFLCLLGVFSAVAGAIATIDVSRQPEIIKHIVGFAKMFFMATPIAIVVGYARNFFGYGRAFLWAKRNDQEIQYSVTWMLETIARFEGVVLTATAFVNEIAMRLPPEQQATVAATTAGLWALIEFISSEFKRTLHPLITK